MENTSEMSLKEKCYAYQKEANYFLDPEKYIIAHIDGRSFSKMVKNKFNKPFDDDFIDAMNQTAIYLCEEVQGAQFAYVQSDEISLCIKKNSPDSQVFFGGRMCKLQSIIASIATSKFNQAMAVKRLDKVDCSVNSDILGKCIDEIKNGPIYQFDCKVWNVDTSNDAMAWFLFRNIDCIRNSKQQTCQTYLSHKILMSKNTDEQVELLKTEKGVDWNAFSDDKKYGRIIKKIAIQYFDDNNDFMYERHKWEVFPFFDMTDPIMRDEFMQNFDLIDYEE